MDTTRRTMEGLSAGILDTTFTYDVFECNFHAFRAYLCVESAPFLSRNRYAISGNLMQSNGPHVFGPYPPGSPQFLPINPSAMHQPSFDQHAAASQSAYLPNLNLYPPRQAITDAQGFPDVVHIDIPGVGTKIPTDEEVITKHESVDPDPASESSQDTAL